MRRKTTTVMLLILGSAMVVSTAFAQKQRMKAYERELENRLEKTLESFRLAKLQTAEEAAAEKAAKRMPTAVRTENAVDPSVAKLRKPFDYTLNMHESNDGDGQDVEIRLTMPIDEFMEFAPHAALEAAAVTHKFPVVYIYLREETTDRVARVAFRDAEPIAGRYLAGDENAMDEMADALIWH